MEVFRNVSVEIEGDYVCIAPLKPAEVDIVAPSASNASYAGVVDQPQDFHIKYAIDAIEYGVVQLPIRFDNVTPEQIETIESMVSDCFNVAITKENNSIILL